MSAYEPNDGRFPDDASVYTRYPLTDDTPTRDEWPWVLGRVLGQCGPNEWHIAIEVPELIEHGDGYDWKPACFRDASELRRAIHDQMPVALQRHNAARLVLATYAELVATNNREPGSDSERRPYESIVWTNWYDFRYLPAKAAWRTAMDELHRAVGNDYPGDHPANFVPYCQEILAGEHD